MATAQLSAEKVFAVCEHLRTTVLGRDATLERVVRIAALAKAAMAHGSAMITLSDEELVILEPSWHVADR